MPDKTLTPDDLVIHVLNVGLGDNIVVELPTNSRGENLIGIVDCYIGSKTLDFLDELQGMRPFDGIAFVCATHPHRDHVFGLPAVLRQYGGVVREFWDSGFRHGTTDYVNLLEAIIDEQIHMKRVSSGMEAYYGQVRVTVLAPSVSLRNRYATYGVDVNNASVVLRFEYCQEDAVSVQSHRYRGTRDPDYERDIDSNVAILGGDAEFDSWAKVAEEYPSLHKNSKHDPAVNKIVNLLRCYFLKVSHHGSMHSAPLDILERMGPDVAGISNRQELSEKDFPFQGPVERNLFPHDLSVLSYQETDSLVLTTDGSYASGPDAADHQHEGSLTVVFTPEGRRGFRKHDDLKAGKAYPPEEVYVTAP